MLLTLVIFVGSHVLIKSEIIATRQGNIEDQHEKYVT